MIEGRRTGRKKKGHHKQDKERKKGKERKQNQKTRNKGS